MVPSRLCLAIFPTTHALTEKLRRKCELVKPKDCVEFAPTKIIVRYTKKARAHDHDLERWNRHAGYARRDYCWCGPNHKDVTTAGYKASPKSVGVFIEFSLRLAAVGRIRTHEEQGK